MLHEVKWVFEIKVGGNDVQEQPLHTSRIQLGAKGGGTGIGRVRGRKSSHHTFLNPCVQVCCCTVKMQLHSAPCGLKVHCTHSTPSLYPALKVWLTTRHYDFNAPLYFDHFALFLSIFCNDKTVNKLQGFFLESRWSCPPSLKSQIKDIKRHRRAACVSGFAGLVFLSSKVHWIEFSPSFLFLISLSNPL